MGHETADQTATYLEEIDDTIVAESIIVFIYKYNSLIVFIGITIVFGSVLILFELVHFLRATL
ncbi:MAG: hypothetical protein WKG06_07040 [Segetibacter sp.]